MFNFSEFLIEAEKSFRKRNIVTYYDNKKSIPREKKRTTHMFSEKSLFDAEHNVL